MRRPRWVTVTGLSALWLGLAPAGCGKRASSNASAAAATPSANSVSTSIGREGGPVGPADAREAEAWERARQGGDEDRMRLEDLVGCERLREAAESPELRTTAVRSMAYCQDFSVLPWLVQVGQSAKGDDGVEALDAIVEQAARPRRAIDPEDADDLAEGCRALLALSRAPEQPRARRVRAIRALRMLADRGCVKRTDIPTELDAK